ncbi:hypothetical protein BHU72_09275 [Desulfuribacillus stibiiarsenatis]|uniref:Polysulfide reductase n=1 Tax=Desulfuribacillus stibiiarsenatis TaxID=1390249 RepID=A0A1E5L2P4_9FIRM|nr:NrfD/PsrC family molybdoenzyme membrane anchor subunit [Desulfuribacillus stibiiarsenatis]OEH84400.1 hypothetical protein BHU72_09275 [Desulfuribacillus stibiiarsenatis]
MAMKETMLYHEVNLPSDFTKNMNLPFMGIIGVLVALFGYGAVMSLIYSHQAWGTSNEVAWGVLISAYVYFAVGCTGLCLLSSLGHVFHIKAFESMGIRPVILAVVSMITAFIIIAVELHYPIRLVIYAILSPNFSSAFIWMGYLYGIYLMFLIAETLLYALNLHRLSRFCAIFAILTGVAATSNLGAVFGTLAARPFWTAPFLPGMFIINALVSGAAALIILFYFVERDKSRKNTNELVDIFGKLLGLFIAITLFFTIWNVLSGYIGNVPERYEATMAMINGPLAISFWVFEIGLGLLVPFLIVLFFAKTQKNLLFAAGLALVGLMFARHNLVTAGQIISLGPETSATTSYLVYNPTFVEYSVVIGAFGVIVVAYMLGERAFVFVQNKYGNIGERQHG